MNHRRSMLKIWGLLLGLFFGAGFGYAQDYYVHSDTQRWVYEAMAVFVEAGYISNYPKDWVKSGHELSRFEIAYYLKQFVERSSKADGKTKPQLPTEIVDLTRKLMYEFAGELTALGIKITDASSISPNLVAPEPKPSDYQDIDLFLKPDNVEHSFTPVPYYYFGQYYNSLMRKSFVFLPAEHLNSGDFALLENDLDNINIVYPNNPGEKQFFLIVKGNLPLTDKQLITGYFMFPIDEAKQNGSAFNPNLDYKVWALLDEVKQLQQIENLWRFEGTLSLQGYLKLDTGNRKNLLSDHLNQGIQIGSLLIFSDSATLKSKYEPDQFGLPSYNPRQGRAVDWDDLKMSNPDYYQINIKGMMSLNSQTSLYGGIDLLYTETSDKALFEGLVPPKAKYSAGVNFQMNDYWTFLSYQSFVNSNTEMKNELLSTTSLGIEYNDWVTLWLAYQMLDFKNDQKVTGVISFRF